VSAPLRAGVCVIGDGAAGMTLAHALRDSGLSVLVVESGPAENASTLDAAEVTGLPYNGLTRGRGRCVGGTTAVWPGQRMRQRAEDLARWPCTHPSSIAGTKRRRRC
jgi:choline dehydrogenase-like flavoprotein